MALLPSNSCYLVAFSLFLAAALRVEGARVRSRRGGGAVVGQDTHFALMLPDSFDFTKRGAPLVEMNVEAGPPAPEKAADMSVTVSVDPQHRLHLHTTSSKGKAGEENWVPVAWAEYKNTVKENGWGYLKVGATSDAKVADDLKMYAAGFLEGYSSAMQIRDFQHNANGLMAKDEDKHHAIENIRSLFNKEIETIRKKSGMAGNKTILSNANQPSDPFWRHAKYALLQGWGILDAYNRYVDKVKGTPMSMVDLLILNSDGETPELEMAYDMEEVLLRQSTRECGECDGDNSTDDTVFLQKRNGVRQRVTHGQVRLPSLMSKARARRQKAMQDLDDKAWLKIRAAVGRCSALVRLTGDNSDIYVGHTTFSDYSEMNRIWKVYDFPLGAGASQRMAFSSYPGVAGSTDDYYIMDSGIVVTETTVSMLSDEPFDKLDDNGTFVPDYMRIMIANRLAKTGKEWVDYMKRSATGTYNSQWMVVDYNLFKPGQQLKDDTFWVLEQAPGLSVGKDMSATLQKTGFWASENRAFFQGIRNISGETEAEDIHGKLFSAEHNPRGNIFAKTAPNVHTLADMRAEMQRNKWPNDVDGGPMNTPDHAIAARGDLDKDSPTPNGGVDSKVTNACLAKLLSADAIAGPTHDDHTPFRWTDGKGKSLYPDYPRDGLPDVWNFDWVRFSPGGEMAVPHDNGCSVK